MRDWALAETMVIEWGIRELKPFKGLGTNIFLCMPKEGF